MTSFLYLTVALTLNACANILIKLGALGAPEGNTSLSLWEQIMGHKLFIVGAVLFACNLVFYFLALKSLPISVAYPVMVGGGFLIINTYAYLFLHEHISPLQIVGYSCIIVGIMLVVSFTRTVSS